MNKNYKKRTNGLFIPLTNDIQNICANCGSDKTYVQIRNGRGTPFWHNHEGKKWCSRCYNNFIAAPKYRKQNNKKSIAYRLEYLGTNLFLSFKLPKDKCEICGVTKEQGKKIARHHYFYCRIMPWSCTISICNSCHSTVTHKGKIKVDSVNRICLICNKTDYYTKIPNRYEDGYICKICYNRINYHKRKKSSRYYK